MGCKDEGCSIDTRESLGISEDDDIESREEGFIRSVENGILCIKRDLCKRTVR